ncbi:MAG: chromosome segregation protein SMC [Pirellulales bacterium]
MLKALELTGFKSFADRTRFEFPQGVSIVVGPNGSGKSNVVDAVKWVLGSQSAKSLRGHEMTDVIFNGCATRGPLGTAEVTLTLDNSQRKLAVDARDVHVTRRVYRSGEGEYLINRQPCRLRDIRELLSVTGITTEAYCIIEQGKVDVLLQSSPRERRLIFEEAAGISQFKLKKAAAARRLERVEQNLLRLSDIVDEVESRLRSVRSQAGKARKYRECSTRLQLLRTQVGLVDWRNFSKQLAAREAQLAELDRKASQHEAAAAKLEAAALAVDLEQETAARARRAIEAQASATRAEIAALEAGVESHNERHSDVEQEVGRFRRQLVAMTARAGSASGQLREMAAALAAAEVEQTTADAEYRAHLDSSSAAQRELVGLRSTIEAQRVAHIEAVRSASLLATQVTMFEAQLVAARSERDKCRLRLDELQEQQQALSDKLAQHRRQESAADERLRASQGEQQTITERLSAIGRELARIDKQQRQFESQLTRTRERLTVLTELHQRLEGLNSGVREVLVAAESEPEGPYGEVRGVVADLFHVDVDSAALVDVALGEFAQYVVVSSAGRLFDWLNLQPLSVAGRVGFLRLDTLQRRGETAPSAELSHESGVMGRADRFVETAGEFAPLAERLLGRTWFVDRLATALRLSQTAGRGLSFVTSDGELLAADGTLVVGPRQASAGLLSRRSEIRACHEQLAELEKQLAHQHLLHSRLVEQRSGEEQLLSTIAAQVADQMHELAEHRQRTAAARGQLEQATHAAARLAQEMQASDEQCAANEYEVASTRDQQAAVTEEAARLESEQAHASARRQGLETAAAALQAESTARQVAAARCEQRVEMLRAQLEQAQRDQQERDLAVADIRSRLAERRGQLVELDAAVLAARQSLAELFLIKQHQAAELARETGADERFRAQRQQIQEQLRTARGQFSAIQSQRHKLDIATNKIRHERQTLAQRMQDDYGIDLATASEAADGELAAGSSELGRTASGSAGPRDAVEREIAELRDQLSQLGSVNLDSLDELDSLESRFGGLSQQYRDLVDAKDALERIIQRINVESRQLFLATLETVRGHFRELFRRLFGGGEADILLEECDDVLEGGIDIVACPPGKEACSISLLSGGEKTLTCVALLLAVFRSKPSPFCILDEVDAALDEANIGRFTGVLRDFLSFTQFVVVTHSKKTMAGADTLYGVTMEESGVSKHVSVRFEDVSEDGEIKLRKEGSLGRAA